VAALNTFTSTSSFCRDARFSAPYSGSCWNWMPELPSVIPPLIEAGSFSKNSSYSL
jgi:hypothetical protein